MFDTALQKTTSILEARGVRQPLVSLSRPRQQSERSHSLKGFIELRSRTLLSSLACACTRPFSIGSPTTALPSPNNSNTRRPCRLRVSTNSDERRENSYSLIYSHPGAGPCVRLSAQSIDMVSGRTKTLSSRERRGRDLRVLSEVQDRRRGEGVGTVFLLLYLEAD